MKASDLPLIYRGSVKDLRGPVQSGGDRAVVFDYTDAYSVFDWGRMPDPIPGKGRALARLATYWLSELEQPEAWQAFSRSPAAQALRRASRFGAAFNELGEKLQAEGLRTHLLSGPAAAPFPVKLPIELTDSQLLVREVNVTRPEVRRVLGREVYDYSRAQSAPGAARLVPLEVVFRFSVPEGSSLLGRVQRNPDYLASIGFPGAVAVRGARWDFPVLELFTKLESTDRELSLQEAELISGVSCQVFEEMLFRTAWVAAFLRDRAERAGVELADGKLEWAVVGNRLMLVDAIGPDELRLLKNGVQLSKEFLRGYYRATPWYVAVAEAKQRAASAGILEWKKGVPTPPALPAELKELAGRLYAALTAEFLGEKSELDAIAGQIEAAAK